MSGNVNKPLDPSDIYGLFNCDFYSPLILKISQQDSFNPIEKGNRTLMEVSLFVPGLFPGTNYTLRVFGENELGGGEYSKEISVVTDGKYTCTDGRYTCTDSKYTCTDGKYTCTTEPVVRRAVLSGDLRGY